MGNIKQEVIENHLNNFLEEKELLTPFLDGFDVSWGKRRRAFNTDISIFFLSPQDHYKESYGFENEVLLAYSPFKKMEPRTLQAIEQVFSESPAKGRVETLSYFLISDCDDIKDWLDSHLSSRQETRIIIPVSTKEIKAAKGDNWFLRKTLNQYFLGRDLFNYSLPLVEDTYFFGRQSIVMEYYDSIRRSENKAIFGLRKTGKTSLLFKIRRLCEAENSTKLIYFDCKLPHIRKARWNELLEELANEITKSTNLTITGQFTERLASKTFLELIQKCHIKGEKICIMFDEIEYISFISPKDKHWREDYLELWQTLWSCQSLYKCISFLIVGVNPTIVETDLIDGVQNPLFGIVPHKYLTGFSIEEIRTMLRKLGKRMGITFENETIEAIRDWYGGHPLLTRQACSSINSFLSHEDKPFRVDKTKFEDLKPRIDQELTFYSNHAISEIREFYPKEYELFELLATEQYLKFKELKKETSIAHLCSYQLITETNREYKINIPVIAQRVALDSQAGDGRQLVYPLIKADQRSSWLKRRIEEVTADIGSLQKIISATASPKLFGSNSFPEGAELQKCAISENREKFSNFINTLNRCFVESIEQFGKDIGKGDYFWKDIKAAYPSLWNVLNRIKVYRNECDHLHLNKVTTEKYFEFLKEDFEGKNFSQLDEPYFILQQRTLDRMLLAIQEEIEALS